MDGIADSINQMVEYAMAFIGSVWFWIIAVFVLLWFLYKKIKDRS